MAVFGAWITSGAGRPGLSLRRIAAAGFRGFAERIGSEVSTLFLRLVVVVDFDLDGLLTGAGGDV